MNIPKAIEIDLLNLKEAGHKMPPDCRDAIKLGIEALKAWERIREGATSQHLWKLPGETKE